MEEDFKSKLQWKLDEIGFKKYRVNIEPHLLKQHNNNFSTEVIGIITIFNRRQLKHSECMDLQNFLDKKGMECYMQGGFVEWATASSYKRRDAFVITIIERQFEKGE